MEKRLTLDLDHRVCANCGQEYFSVESDEDVELWNKFLSKPEDENPYNTFNRGKLEKFLILYSEAVERCIAESGIEEKELNYRNYRSELQDKYLKGYQFIWNYKGLPIHAGVEHRNLSKPIVEPNTIGAYVGYGSLLKPAKQLKKWKEEYVVILTSLGKEKYENSLASADGCCPRCGSELCCSSVDEFNEKRKQKVDKYINNVKAGYGIRDSHPAVDASKINVTDYLKQLVDLSDGVFFLESQLRRILLDMEEPNNTIQRLTIKEIKTNDNGAQEIEELDKQIDNKKEQIASLGEYSDEQRDIIAAKNGIKKPIDAIKPEKPSEPSMPSELPINPDFLTEPSHPIFKTPGLFNKKQIEKENQDLQAQYDIAVKIHHQEQEKLEANLRNKEEYEKQYSKYKEALKDFEKAERDYYEGHNKYLVQLSDYNQAVNQLVMEERKRITDMEMPRLDNELRELEERKRAIKQDVNNGVYIERSLNKKAEYIEAKAYYDFLEKERDECATLLTEQCGYIEELLQAKILFPKYNNIVAWSTMYEYFITGRVAELAGPNGAYNLYESELRANTIISQLDVIISELEEIKQNQYVLYETISETNKLLLEMIDDLDDIRDNAESIAANSRDSRDLLNKIYETDSYIAYNTAKIAKYSKITAVSTAATAIMKGLWG